MKTTRGRSGGDHWGELGVTGVTEYRQQLGSRPRLELVGKSFEAINEYNWRPLLLTVQNLSCLNRIQCVQTPLNMTNQDVVEVEE